MDLIYLDHNATTRPSPEVAAAVAEATQQLWANPSSVHRFGQQVRQRLELARAATARLIGAKPREVVFTSGGTEAAGLALGGLVAALPEASPDGGSSSGVTLLTTRAEHAAVREWAEAWERRGGRVIWLPLAQGGAVDPAGLREALGQLPGPAVVSVMWANNETGVITPLADVAAAVAEARQQGRRVWLHSDATQAVGKLTVDAQASGADLLSFAAHKYHGPKGVGGLWVRRGVRLRARQVGGPQEMERRGGTENVPGILGAGVAADQAAAFVEDTAQVHRLRELRDQFERSVIERLADGPRVVVNGGGVERLWNTSNLGFRGLEAEAVLLGLSERGVCASAGAACSSGSLEPSPVLRAMGIDEPTAHGSVRFSLGRWTTWQQIDAAAEAVAAVVGRLARVMPIGGGV
jgi:cysteine desulfurase